MHLLRRVIGDIVEANVPQRRGEGDGRGHQQLPPLGKFWAGRRPRRTFGPLIFTWVKERRRCARFVRPRLKR